MRTKGQKRIVRWTMDLQQWALKQGKLHPGSDEADYALGIIMAINVSQRKSAPMNEALLDRQPRETQFGYIDGIALLNKVVELVDAPAGEFRELLGLRTATHLGAPIASKRPAPPHLRPRDAARELVECSPLSWITSPVANQCGRTSHRPVLSGVANP